MKAAGKAPKTILIAIARQLLVILNAMIRNRQPIRL
jgi:transposase